MANKSFRALYQMGASLGLASCLGALPNSAYASCESLGTLRSLSTTADGSQSLWLSRTQYGSVFALDATRSSARVDTWSGTGFHLSRSPVVAGGSAGAHTLSEISGDGGDCPIATVNQLLRPNQSLPSVPDRGGNGGGDGGGDGDGGGGGGNSGGGGALTESALLGFSPVLLGQVSITERLTRGALGPSVASNSAGAEEASGRLMWLDTAARYADNDQGSRDGNDSSAKLTFGHEVWRDEIWQVGVAGGFDAAKADAFDNFVSSNVDSYFIGPYLGWKPNEDTLLDIWLGYANRDYTNSIGPYDSSFDADRFFVDANVTRHVQVGAYSVLPKIGVFYARENLPDHRYSDGAFNFGVSGAQTDTVIGKLAIDVWKDPVPISSGLQLLPFVSAGVDWYAELPGDGQVLESDLEVEEVSSVVGSLALGADVLMANGGRWTTKLSYNGMGLSGYEDIGLDVALNFRF